MRSVQSQTSQSASLILKNISRSLNSYGRFTLTPVSADSGAGSRDESNIRRGTMIVVWDIDHQGPWGVITDLPPDGAGVRWYALP